METNEKNFDEKETLRILNETISVAKGNLDDGYFYFVLWGFVIALVYFSKYFLIKFSLQDYSGYTNFYFAIGGLISFIYAKRQEKQQSVNTYIEKWLAYIWITFGIQWAVAIVCLMVLGQISILTPIFLILIGGATLISGGLVKNKPLIIGGIIFFVFAIATFFVSNELQYLLAGAAMILGNVIPALIYRQISKKENV